MNKVEEAPSQSASVSSSMSTFEDVISEKGVLCYTISGVSMLPLLHQHKDIVVLKKPDGRCHKYDVVLYKTDAGKYILHRVLEVRPDDYVICGDNCIRKEYGITDKHILGVMTEFVRKGKTCSLESRTYRIYTHLVSDGYPVKACFLWLKMMVRRAGGKVLRMLKLRNVEKS